MPTKLRPQPQVRLQPTPNFVDILILDVASTKQNIIDEYKKKFSKRGHELHYSSFEHTSSYSSAKQRERLNYYTPIRGEGPSAALHSFKASEHFLKGFNSTLIKDKSSTKFRIHILNLPAGYKRSFKTDRLYPYAKGTSVGIKRGHSLSNLPEYQLIDDYINRNPGIKAMISIYGANPENREGSDFSEDVLNELASKNGRRIMVNVAGGNDPKTHRTNVRGYQDFELDSSSYKHFTLVNQRRDTLNNKFTSTQKNAPQLSFEPHNLPHTSYITPQTSGMIFGMIRNAVIENGLNGNTIMPAILLDYTIDKLNSEKKNSTIFGKKNFTRLIKSSLDDIIKQNKMKEQSPDSFFNNDNNAINYDK